MSESKEAKKIKTIAFRLTDEEYARAESAAIAAGDETPSSWCRTLVLQQASLRVQNDQEPATDLRGDRTSAIPRREWIQDVVWVRANHGCNVEKDHGKRRSEFGDHCGRPTLAKEVAPTANRITASSQRPVDCQFTLLRNTYHDGFHNRPRPRLTSMTTPVPPTI